MTWLALAGIILGTSAWFAFGPGKSGANGTHGVSATFIGTRLDSNGLRCADFVVTNHTSGRVSFLLMTVPDFERPLADYPLASRALVGRSKFAQLGEHGFLAPRFQTNYSLPAPLVIGCSRVELEYTFHLQPKVPLPDFDHKLLRRVGLKKLSERWRPKYCLVTQQPVTLPSDIFF